MLSDAIAARSSPVRIGSGVRLTPKFDSHRVRTAESGATLGDISDGRVEAYESGQADWVKPKGLVRNDQVVAFVGLVLDSRNRILRRSGPI